MSYLEKAKAGASAPPSAAAATSAAAAPSDGLQGCTVLVNVPSYGTGNGQAITKVTGLVVVDLQRKHLVLTSALGAEMLFQIHQDREDVERVDSETHVSKAVCMQRLRSFLLSMPDVDVCLVQQPFMDKIATMDHTVPTKVEFRKRHQAILLYDSNATGPSPAVFLSAYMDGRIEVKSKKYMDVETRFPVTREDYCIAGKPNSDIGANVTVSPSRLDVVHVYSTFERNPTDNDDNYDNFYAGHGVDRSYLRLKPASAERLKGQIVETLVQLAEANPLQDDERDADDYSCSEYVFGDFEERHELWIEYDPEKAGKYEIKWELYIKKSPKK